jgi:hypothetical protein
VIYTTAGSSFKVVAPMAANRRVDFADIKSRADFRAILAHYGIQPIGMKDQAKIRCPCGSDCGSPASWQGGIGPLRSTKQKYLEFFEARP